MNLRPSYPPLFFLVFFSLSACQTSLERGVDISTSGVKQLHVTVDITDDIWRSQRQFNKGDINNLIEYFASLGITRVYWVVTPELKNISFALSVPTDPFLAFRMIVDVAHEAGIELYAVFKPFETAPGGNTVPNFISLPPGMSSMPSITGQNFFAVSFLRQHPEYRVKRRPIPDWKQKTITTIKLVNDSSERCQLQLQDIEIWVSSSNGNFVRYEDNFTLSDALEQRDGEDVRVFTLKGLHFDPEYRYILLKSNKKHKQGTCGNKSSKLVELYGAEDDLIPHSVDQGAISRSSIISKVQRMWLYATGKWGVPAQYQVDSSYGNFLESSAFSFEMSTTDSKRYFDGRAGKLDGYVAIAKGKPASLSTLQPLYPEVREYWLHQIQTLIEAGVDGIDIRVSNHSSFTSEPLEYGFGPGVVNAYRNLYQVNILDHPVDIEKWKTLQGVAYTDFLRRARELTKNNRVKLQLHINALMGTTIPFWNQNNVPENVKYQWQAWIQQDLPDSVMLKSLPWIWGAAKGSGTDFAGKVIRVAKKFGKDISWEWRLDCWWLIPSNRYSKKVSQRDIDRITERGEWGFMHPSIDAVNIYEGFDFTYIGTGGVVNGSVDFENTMRLLLEKSTLL